MEYYGGAVCCILFHEIPWKGKGRALPETETVTQFVLLKCISLWNYIQNKKRVLLFSKKQAMENIR